MDITENVCNVVPKKNGALPEKVLQIGEGNFLRAFADWMIDKMNTAGLFGGSVVMCQPTAHGAAEKLNAQDCEYTVLMRGIENGRKMERSDVVTSVARCLDPYRDFDAVKAVAASPDLKVIISNTTEAGIAYRPGDKLDDAPPISYPAKLTALLWERFKSTGGRGGGLLILPVELIKRNGDSLRALVLRYADEWGLTPEFVRWLGRKVCFANTLVDRIVTGFPKNEISVINARLGYEDDILVACEPYYEWIIEAPKRWRQVLPFEKAGLNVAWVDDVEPYRTRKVRILNGTHTMNALAAYLSGCESVSEMMRDADFSRIIPSALSSEIIPNIALPRETLSAFAESVLERFSNPFIKHRLLDISLNSVSKYRARCLDSLSETYSRTGSLPPVLCFALAALIEFYKGREENGRYFGLRGGEKYEIRDSARTLAFFSEAWARGDAVRAVLSNTDFWGRDLTLLGGLTEETEKNVEYIEKYGMRRAVSELARRM